jgi:hypothetical protein
MKLIPSLLVICSCLATSPAAKAGPKPGLTPVAIPVGGAIEAVRGTSLGTARVLLPATAESVTGAFDDVASFKIEGDDAVSFSATLLTPAMQERVTFPDGTGLMVTTGGATYASVGPNELHVEAPVTVMDVSDPSHRTSNWLLIGDLSLDEDGSIKGIYTLSAPSVDN